MSKTEQIIKLLEEEKTPAEIKSIVGCSDALITRCKGILLKAQNKSKEEPEDTEPTDTEIEEVIKKIKITPEKKYLSSENNSTDEDYRCMGCKHEWKSKSVPTKCPKCGCEF
jgi:rubrerythrin